MDQFHYHVSSEPRTVASGPFIRPLRFSVVGDPRLLPNAVDRKYDPMCDALAFDNSFAAFPVQYKAHSEDRL
jgi:hypothetical protein